MDLRWGVRLLVNLIQHSIVLCLGSNLAVVYSTTRVAMIVNRLGYGNRVYIVNAKLSTVNSAWLCPD